MTTEVFPGRFESLPKIRDFVVSAAISAGLNDLDVYAVELAVDEACSNIIEHAYGGEGVGDIQCTCRVSEDDLTIILKDNGQPFEPESIPEPNFSGPLEDLKPGGAGLFLMRKMMDKVQFEFTPDYGNTLVMVKRVEK
jgi:serine/threonine-protein kinase RsbW